MAEVPSLHVLFQVIHFSISKHFSSIWSIDRTLSGASTPGMSWPGNDGNEGVFHSPQNSSITETSPFHCLASYPGDSLGCLTPLQRRSKCILLLLLTVQTIAGNKSQCSNAYQHCSLMARQTKVQSLFVLYQSLKKRYMILPFLTLIIVRYVWRVKWRNYGKRLAPSSTLWCSSYWKMSLQVALDFGCQLYLWSRWKRTYCQKHPMVQKISMAC